MSETCISDCLNSTDLLATRFEHDEHISKIHVVRRGGTIDCFIDNGLEESKSSTPAKNYRYGGVFFDGREGMHLFSHGYTMHSMAAQFCSRKESEVLQELEYRFHPLFITKIAVASRYRCASSIRTRFDEDGQGYFSKITHSFNTIKSGGDLKKSLEAYLNYVGGLMYILPANVLYAENAKDGEGGQRAGQATSSIPDIFTTRDQKKRYAHIEDNIELIIDPKVIQNIFGHGFDQNNLYCLAFIILHVCELRTLVSPIPTRKMEPDCFRQHDDVFAVIKQRIFKDLPLADLEPNFDKACELIRTEWNRKEVRGFCIC